MLAGTGGKGGMALSDVESKLNDVDEDEEEEEAAKRFGKYERLVVTCRNLSTNDFVSGKKMKDH